MKVTVIVGEDSKIVGAFHGHSQDIRSKPGLFAIPVAGPGQKFHEIDVPDEIFPEDASQETLQKLPESIKPYLRAK